MEPLLFVVAAIHGHRIHAPGCPLTPGVLLGPAAARRVSTYREECARRFGYFDERTVLRLLQTGGEPIERRMMDSELIAGSHISRRRRAGGIRSVATLYEERELGLDPLWLATEPSYHAWLRTGPPSSKACEDQRRRVALSDRHALAAGTIRSRVFLRTVAAVLERQGFRPDDLRWPATVQSAVRVWTALGDVMGRLDDLSVLWVPA